MLVRLTYVSHARSKLPQDLKDILAETRANNSRLKVTGALCFLDGAYLQLLEGEREVLLELYRKIERDSRHKDVKILTQRMITQRAFPNWSMGLLTWNEETREIFARFNGATAIDLYAADPSNVEDMFIEMGRSSNWQTVAPPPSSY